MKIVELRQLLQDLPDDMQIEFGAEGTVYGVDAAFPLPEWNTLYLGVEKEELAETLMEYEQDEMETDRYADIDYDEGEADVQADRSAFQDKLEKAENEDEVACCPIDTKPTVQPETSTEMM